MDIDSTFKIGEEIVPQSLQAIFPANFTGFEKLEKLVPKTFSGVVYVYRFEVKSSIFDFLFLYAFNLRRDM